MRRPGADGWMVTFAVLGLLAVIIAVALTAWTSHRVWLILLLPSASLLLNASIRYGRLRREK